MKNPSRKTAAFIASVVMAGLIGLAGSSPAFTQDKKPTVSREVAKPLKAAQDAINAKNWQQALQRLKEVEAVPNRSEYDNFLLNEMLGFTYVRMNNMSEAAKALEAGSNSQYFEQKDLPQRVRALAQVNYQLKNYDKAIEYGNRAIKGGYADDDMYTLIGQAYYIKGDYKGTLKFMEGYVDQQARSGGKPKEQSLQIISSSCVKLDDAGCISNALERLVAFYPKPEYWEQLIYSLFQNKGSDAQLLHVYRLASEVDVLKRPEDYTEMAQLAIEQGSPGEAQRILEKGFAKNVFNEAREQDKNKRLLESARKQATADRASLTKIEADVAKATTGDRDIGLGLAYLSYEEYDKAATALSRGLQKGGVKNEASARLLLGIAQLKGAKKDEAVKSFKAVKGDPQLERLANLWGLHAQQA